MYSKKQHIARKTIITCLAFAGGMISTVLAAAVYDANVQNRANTIFDVIKNNASTMDQSDSTAYYNLVRLNIKSLVEVLTAVDGKILTEIGSTLPGLDDIDIIGELTGTGNIGSGNALSNSQIKLTATFDGSSGDKAIFNANSAVTFSWIIPTGFTECEGNGGNSSWSTAMRNSISTKIAMNVVSVATPYSITCYDQNRKLINSNLIGFVYDPISNTMSFKRDYACTVTGQSLQVAGNCTCPDDKSYVSTKSNSCITREVYTSELNLQICTTSGGKIGSDGLCKYDTATDSKQRIFIKFKRSLPSSEYSRAENECGIPLGQSSCTINIDWYSSADTKTMELFSSVAGAPYTLLQSALISSRTLTLSPSTETKIRFTSNPGNQIDEIIFKGMCTSGGKWTGTSCESDTSVGGNNGIGNTADVDIVLHTPNGTSIQKGTELTFGMSAVFNNPKDTDTCNLSYSTSSGKSKLVDFRSNGRVSDNISRGRNPELWNEYIAAGGSRSVTILFEDIEAYYPNNQSTVVFTCNNVQKEAIVTFKAKPIVTTLETNKNEAKIGDSVDVQYGVSADRTCSIYVVKSGNVLKKDIAAGTNGMVTYLIKEGDRNTVGNLEFEMSCSNGSKKSKDVKITTTTNGGFTSTISEVVNNVAKIYTYQVNEGMQVSEYVDATEELARRQCADRQNSFNNQLAIQDGRDIRIRCTWKGFEFFSYMPAGNGSTTAQIKNITGSMEEIGKVPEYATNNRDYFFAYLDNSVNPVGSLAIITEAEAKTRCQEVRATYPKSSLQCSWRGLVFSTFAPETPVVVGPTSPVLAEPTSPVVVGPTSPTANLQLVMRRQQIADLYRTVLGREPDEPGLNYWVNDSMTIEQIRANFVQVKASEQSQQNNTTTVVGPSPVVVGPTSPVVVGPTPALSPRVQQISDLYRSVLGREPDEGGLSYWTNDSMDINQIRENFFNSPEYQQNQR